MQTIIKRLTVIFLFCTLLFCACSSDSPTTPPPTEETENNIYGTITIPGESDFSGIQVVLIATVKNAPASIWAKASQWDPDYDLSSLSAVGIDTTFTNTAGNYEFQDVPAGTYTIHASLGNDLVGYYSGVQVGGSGDTTVEALALSPTGSITGIILLDGQTVHSGVIVFVAGTSYAAFTGASGAYTITGVPAGSHQVMAARWGYVTMDIGQVVVTAGAEADAGTTSLAAASEATPFVALTYPTQGAVVPIPSTSPYPDEEYDSRNGLGILIQFSTSMDWESVENALTITPELGTEIVVRGDALYIMTETDYWNGNPLQLDTAYSITIGTGAQDIFGTALAAPFALEFTTGGLTIGKTYPENGATIVPGLAEIRTYPNAPLDPNFGLSETTVTFSPEVLGTWDGEYSYDGSTYELLAPFQSETSYQVTVSGLRDINGNEMDTPYQFSFTTGPVLFISSQPGDGEVVDPDAYLSLGFTAQMSEASLLSNLIVSPPVDLRVSGWGSGSGGRSYSLRPVNNFWPAGTTFSVTVPAGVTDYYGVAISNPTSFSFTTAPFGGVESYPFDGEQGVDRDLWGISVTFNSQCDESTVTSSLSVNPSFSYDLDYSYSRETIRLEPTESLAPSTEYTVTFSTALTTETGEALAEPFSFSFVTRAE